MKAGSRWIHCGAFISNTTTVKALTAELRAQWTSGRRQNHTVRSAGGVCVKMLFI